MIEKLAIVGSICLPLWNIPLIWHIVKRQSSNDISLSWAIGIWVCILMMFPQAMVSNDFIWKTFSIINMIMFTAVVATVVFYRFKNKNWKD